MQRLFRKFEHFPAHEERKMNEMRLEEADAGYYLIDIERVTNKKEKEETVESFTCQICLGLTKNPLIDRSNCDMVFCSQCLEAYWAKTKVKDCPLRCSNPHFTPLSRIEKASLGSLQISCIFKLRGCQEVLLYELLESHEKGCIFESAPIETVCRACNQRLQRYDKVVDNLNKHLISVLEDKEKEIAFLESNIKLLQEALLELRTENKRNSDLKAMNDKKARSSMEREVLKLKRMKEASDSSFRKIIEQLENKDEAAQLEIKERTSRIEELENRDKEAKLEMKEMKERLQELTQIIDSPFGNSPHIQSKKEEEVKMPMFQKIPHQRRRVIVAPKLQNVVVAKKILPEYQDLTFLSNTQILKEHSKAVTAVVHLKDGNIATASHDSTIKIWNLLSENCVLTLKDHIDKVWGLIESKNGKLVSASEDRTIKVWNVLSGFCECTLKNQAEAYQIAELKDGRIAVPSKDSKIRIWSILTQAIDATLSGHTASVWQAIQLQNGKIASASHDKTVRIWNISDGSCEEVLNYHSGWVTGICQLDDGRIVSGSVDGTVRIWDLTTNICKVLIDFESKAVSKVAQLSKSQIICAGADKAIKVVNVSTGECEGKYDGHRGCINDIALLNDEGFVSVSNDKTIMIWQ